MKNSFFKIFGFLVAVTAIATGVVVFSVLMAIAYFLTHDYVLMIPYGVAFAVIAVMAGSFSYVIFSIPFDLAVKFDVIKNDIASGKLSDIDEAQKTIGEFTIQFFNYVGADVVCAKVHFEGGKKPFVSDCNTDIDRISQEELKQKRKHRIDREHKAFYLPVVFEERELGYLLLVTHGPVYPFFYKILEYYEDFFLDDQVKCLVRQAK